MLFSDLCASTDLGHRSDPEVLAQVLEEVKSAAFRVLERHQGIVVQFHGDGVLAIFGHPTPQEEDVRRAAEAALELHRVVRELPLHHLVPKTFQVRLHSGIHSGLVLVRAGDPVQGRFELIGDPPNTAAGLCSHAGRDEILSSAATLRGVLPFFHAEEVDPVRLKGKPDPIPVFRVLGRTTVATKFEARTRRGLTPFVGREQELERLFRRLGEASRGRLRVLRLVADAGLGKTRVVEEFIRRAEVDGHAAFRGYCERYGDVAPLQPILLMLEQVFALERGARDAEAASKVEGRLEELGLEGQASQILRILDLPGAAGALAGEAPSGPQPATVTIQALSELLGALAAKSPLILFIDDWQWVDDASRQVFGALIRRLREAPVLFVTASRQLDPSDEASPEVEVLELSPFDQRESARAIACLLPDHLELGMSTTIHERSGGNPLFLEEICQSLSSSERGSVEDTSVPATLHGLIEARVHRLPRAQADLVRTAAVIGNVIPSWLLEQVSGHREGDEIFRRLASNDLLYSGEVKGTLRFKHGITRDVVYQSVGLAQRQALHLRIAQALSAHRSFEGREEPLEALAHHHAGGAAHLEASRYAELAGDRAMARAATDRARQQYAAALASLDQLDATEEIRRRWLEIAKRRAFACVFEPAPDQLEMLEQMAVLARELGDHDALGHARFWLGFINYSLGNQKESIEQYQQGLREAEEAGSPKLVAQLRANLGQSLASACEYPAAIELLDESIEAKSRLRSDKSVRATPTGSAFAIACKGFIKADVGDFSEAHELMDRALEAVRGSGSPVEGSIRSFQAVSFAWQGRWEDCIDVAGRVQSMAERVRGPYLFGRGRSEAAYARFMLNRDPDSLEILRQTTDWLEARRMRLYISLNFGWLADAMTWSGRDDLARHYGRRAFERARQQDRIGEGSACRALAILALREGAAADRSPEHYLEMALKSARHRGSAREIAMTQLSQANMSAERGDRRAAEGLLEQARCGFSRMAMHWHCQQAERLAAALGG